ncbi:MAG TPA: general stress protein [Gemmatimonadales bacterium]|nr:general stress protein [Gemmatimonadales bacterium]
MADIGNRTGRTVVALFHDRSDAEEAIRDLKDSGFTKDRIGIAMQDRGEQRGLTEATEASPTAKGAATGALTGGLLGGMLGLLGSLLIPGLGPIVAGGVLESVLVGAGAGAATGGLIGALVGLGVPEEAARHFAAGFREGGILVTVDAGPRTEEAVLILQSCNADLGPSRPRAPTGEPAYEPPATVERALGTGASDLAPMGDAAVEGVRSSWTGVERRYHQDASYTGPERRLTPL